MSGKIFVDNELDADYKLILTLLNGKDEDKIVEILVTEKFTHCLDEVQDDMVESIYFDSRDVTVHTGYSWRLIKIGE